VALEQFSPELFPAFCFVDSDEAARAHRQVGGDSEPEDLDVLLQSPSQWSYLDGGPGPQALFALGAGNVDGDENADGHGIPAGCETPLLLLVNLKWEPQGQPELVLTAGFLY